MICDLIAHWSADLWDLAARLWMLARDGALLLVLSAFWSPSEVEAYREEWEREVQRGR